MKKKSLFLIILLISGVMYALPAVHTDVEKELLRNLSSAKHDISRLNILDELIKQNLPRPEVRTRYIGELLEEAELQKNTRYQSLAYLYYILMEYNKQDKEGVEKWMRKLEPVARKSGHYDLLWQGEQCIINMLMLNEEYELAERKAGHIRKEAQELNSAFGQVIADMCMAGVYQSTFRTEESIAALEHAYSLASKMEEHPTTTTEITSYLISIYRNTKDYPNWLKYLKIQESQLQTLVRKSPDRKELFKGDFLMLYLSYLRYYAQQNQIEIAEKYKLLAEEYYTDEYTAYKLSYYRGMMAYYQTTGEFEKALAALNQVLSIFKGKSQKDYCTAFALKGELLSKLGRYEEAIAAEKELLHEKDSLRISIYDKQVEQLNASYDADSAFLARSRAQSYFKLTVLGAATILILVLCYFAIRYYHIRQGLVKSERKMRQIAGEVKKATEVKERFLENMSYAIRSPLNEVVRNSLLLATDRPVDDQTKETVARTITETSAQLMALVNDILNLSRLEAGRMKYSISEVDIKSLIIDVIGISSCKVQFDSPVPEGTVVMLDGARLAEVLQSLLVTEDPNDLWVKLEKSEEEGLIVTVINTRLASPEPAQDIIIRNEINRMIIQHFAGTYNVGSGIVRFTLKL